MAVTDSVIVECGSLGKYQLLQYLLMMLLSISAAQQFLVVNFHNFEPKYQCSLAGWYNGTNDSLTSYNPNLNSSENVCEKNGTQCQKFVFSKKRYPGNTLVTKFNLVCDNTSISTISTTLFTCCLMVGALVGGVIADRIGRRWSTIIQAFLATAGSAAIIFTQNMYMYVALRGLIGASTVGIFIALASIGLEITGPRQRTTSAAIQVLAFPLGTMSLSPIAYFLPDWNNIQIFITVFYFASSILALIFLKESPHYLVGKGRYEEAENILKSMARMNGKIIDGKIFERLRSEQDVGATEKLIGIFRAITLLKRAAIFFYLWFVAGMANYGMSFNTKNMSGNIFVNNALIECPGLLTPFAMALSKYLGRKSITIFHLFLGSAALLTSAMLTIFTDIEDSTMSTVILIVSMVGKYSIAVLFAFNYLWCIEVFPTTLRASLGGTASFFARVGSIFSPFLVDLYKYVHTGVGSGLGPLIFSITLLWGAILTFFLPETSNTRIPETIHEANIYMTKGHEEMFRAVRQIESEGVTNDGAELDEKFSDEPKFTTKM